MSLTPEMIATVRNSWTALSMDPDTLTRTFYAELFRIAPEVRPMFAGTDLQSQRRKLAAAIAMVVHRADNLAAIVPALEDLGRRHVGYGVSDAQYDAVGRALIHAIAAFHGPSFTPAIQEAWVAAYTAVASAMQAGAATAFRKSA
ncbi:globin domain-containing protein [Albidovulum sediminicola]|uniref:Globin domain-containing protein n=1 Tax=Albidovulum sediminicola TaxID=2984331 RepID=A0ABT2YZA3_9RHOB|nr:globin domain-containing protein [Defluviimonas sp. WL0075]MCV2864206.1 globin domain-containing protein [Defluviimonas sp. WL0075]